MNGGEFRLANASVAKRAVKVASQNFHISVPFLLFTGGAVSDGQRQPLGMISKLADLNAALASLLIKADTAMETEIVITCEKRFNAYEIFEKSFYEYTSNIENAFENSSVTPTFIINTTQKLKNSLNALINENL